MGWTEPRRLARVEGERDGRVAPDARFYREVLPAGTIQRYDRIRAQPAPSPVRMEDSTRIHVRLGPGLSRLSQAPRLDVELAEGATVFDLLRSVAADRPALAPGLPSALTVVRGSQVGSDRVLEEDEEVALLMPVAGG